MADPQLEHAPIHTGELPPGVYTFIWERIIWQVGNVALLPDVIPYCTTVYTTARTDRLPLADALFTASSVCYRTDKLPQLAAVAEWATFPSLTTHVLRLAAVCLATSLSSPPRSASAVYTVHLLQC